MDLGEHGLRVSALGTSGLTNGALLFQRDILHRSQHGYHRVRLANNRHIRLATDCRMLGSEAASWYPWWYPSS
jgi:hypothetical protein